MHTPAVLWQGHGYGWLAGMTGLFFDDCLAAESLAAESPQLLPFDPHSAVMLEKERMRRFPIDAKGHGPDRSDLVRGGTPGGTGGERGRQVPM